MAWLQISTRPGRIVLKRDEHELGHAHLATGAVDARSIKTSAESCWPQDGSGAQR